MAAMKVLVLLAFCVASCWAKAVSGGSKPWNPLCPKKLTTDKARYKCYSKVLHNIFVGVSQVNFADLLSSSNVFRPWMTDDIQGRGAPGSFNGIDLNSEYLAVAWPAFVAGGKTNNPPDLSYFTQSGNVVSFSTNYLIHDPVINRTANWTIWGYARFTDEKNLMSHYDLDFRWYGEFLEVMMLDNLPPQARTAIAGQICNRTMDLCVGGNRQYDSVAACVSYLETRPFIIPSGRIASDCLLCRTIHSILMPFDLLLHCPHVGPSGPKNSACTSSPLSAYYTFFKPKTYIGMDKLFEYSPV